jgi:hypothetical protein
MATARPSHVGAIVTIGFFHGLTEFAHARNCGINRISAKPPNSPPFTACVITHPSPGVNDSVFDKFVQNLSFVLCNEFIRDTLIARVALKVGCIGISFRCLNMLSNCK